jgi:preprotein translocase subunit SecA
MRDVIFKMITDIVENDVNMVIGEESSPESWDLAELNQLLLPVIPLKPITLERLEKHRKTGVIQQLKEEATKLYEEREAMYPSEENIRERERVVLLRVIDMHWMNHIDEMEQLKQGIGMVAYGQKDPVVEYKMAGFDMFDSMTEGIKVETVRLMMHLPIEQRVERQQVAKVTGTNKDDSVQKGPKRRTEEKIYPNSPCPCGSGKKYKNCCGKNA